MQYWEQLTRLANKAHSNHAFSDSVELNRQALAFATEHFDEDFRQDAESAVAASIVSYLNMAESYTSLGDYLSANTQYERAVHFLQTALSRVDVSAEQRDLLSRTATHVRFEWELFSQSHGTALSIQSKSLVQALSNAVAQPRSMVRH